MPGREVRVPGERARGQGLRAFSFISVTIVTAALFAVALIAMDAYFDRSSAAGRTAVAQVPALGPLLNVASEGFLNFECAGPTPECGAGAAERYCLDRGQALVRWRAEPVPAASAPNYRFSMAEIVCRSM